MVSFREVLQMDEWENHLQKGYITACDRAQGLFAKQDPFMVSEMMQVPFNQEESVFLLNFMGKDTHITYPLGQVLEMSGNPSPVIHRVLILHYLNCQYPQNVTGNLVSYREIKDGQVYYPTFYKRAVQPFINAFGYDTTRFANLVSELGWKKERYGTVSATCRIFPRIPVTYILWEGDDEISPSGTILYDESASSILPSEDLVMIASLPVYQLLKAK